MFLAANELDFKNTDLFLFVNAKTNTSKICLNIQNACKNISNMIICLFCSFYSPFYIDIAPCMHENIDRSMQR